MRPDMGLFFIFLFLSLFCPQNHDSLLEAYWAIALIILSIIHGLPRRPQTPVSKQVVLLWAGVLTTLGVTAIHGRSIAASIPAIVRYVEGCAVCLLFMSASSHDTRSRFVTSATTMGWLAIIVFFAALLIPQVASVFPEYNGVIAVNGHHPIAYFLVFLFPLFLSSAKRGTHPFLNVFLPVAALIISGARGGLIIILLFLAIRAIRTSMTMQLRLLTSAGIATLCIILSGLWWVSFLPEEQKTNLRSIHPFIRIYVKEANIAPRLEYVRQTVAAVRAAPILGHGPGTFALLSRQFQSQAGYFARHAHSYLLEAIAENGAIGSIPIVFFWGYILVSLGRDMKRRAISQDSSLTRGVFLTFLYSMFEANLSALSLWILVWAAIGLLAARNGKTYKLPPFILPVTTFFLTLYAGSFVLSMTFQAAGYAKMAVFTAPYRKNLLVLQQDTAQANGTRTLITYLYAKDPDIMISSARQAPEQDAKKLYTETIRLDPYHDAYRKAYLTYLFHRGETDTAKHALCDYAKLHAGILSPTLCAYMENTIFDKYLHAPDALPSALAYLNGRDGVAQFFYFLGWSAYQYTSDVTGTLLFWQAARDNAPHWGYYHLELASAEYYWAGDIHRATATLARCMQYDAARAGCTRVHQAPARLLPPGSLMYDIAAIPKLLP